ncbi:signal protein [Streptomyces sp.]|uniref:signal protein n=1 Tax=Streptomyces sp. TaxID=1931 RepID=UPI002D793107|nr:signal protein [Streptomyces sp.]HET6360214.1 signal protein [Streptomyces sp.]
MKFTSGLVVLAAILLAASVGCRPASSTTAGTRSVSAELQGKWWTWAASEPEETNPVADRDGSECDRNQPRDVWFLAGTFGGKAKRTCTVPTGRPIAFPVVNLFGLSEDCAAFMATAKGRAVLDGETILPEVYDGEAITVQSAAGNAVTGREERYTATGCGLWVQLPPLEPGKHALKIRGHSGDLSVDVDYALTVEAPSV